MNISKYKAFLTVAEMGSISKAAKVLKYSQPGISHMISSLEEEFGFPILKRINKNYVLTENGKQIVGYCQQIVKNEENLINTVSSINGLLTGSISIASYSSMIQSFVPNTVSEFIKIFPNVKISIYEGDYNVMDLGLKNNMFDIAFTSDKVPNGFTFIPLFKDPLGLLIHKDHPFNKYEKIPSNILNGCNFILHTTGAWNLMDSLINHECFDPASVISTNSDCAIVQMVSHNVGVSIMSSFHKNLFSDDVVFKRFEYPHSRILGIGIRSMDYASPAVKEFIYFAQEKAKSHEYYYKNDI